VSDLESLEKDLFNYLFIYFFWVNGNNSLHVMMQVWAFAAG